MKPFVLLCLFLLFSGCGDDMTNNNNGNTSPDFDIYLLNINSSLRRFETYTVKSDGTNLNLFSDSLFVGASSRQNKILMGNIDTTGYFISAIYSADYYGANLVNIPLSIYYPVYFDLSPIGDKALFTTDEGNFLCIVNTNATGLLKLSDGIRGTEVIPKFSPNGNLIAYFEAPPSLETGLYITNTSGTYKKLLKDSIFYDNGFTLDWSPDGSKIVYQNRISNGNETKICIIDTSGSGYSVITDGWCPSWSPNGDKISFFVNVNQGVFDLFLMNPDGTGIINISNSISEYDNDAKWSPDGPKLMYSSHGFNNVPFTKIYDISSNTTQVIANSFYGEIWK